MEYALLTSFLQGTTSPSNFAKAIKLEVDVCVEGTQSEAKTGQIIAPHGPTFIVAREHVRRLLEAMLDDQIPWHSANYTCDCLIMSDDFESANHDVAEVIAFLTDDSRPPTVSEIRNVRDALA